MKDKAEHTCQLCYYEYFDGRTYPCSMCVCGEEHKDMFQPKGRQNKRKDEPRTETEIARAIVHKMIDDAVIAEDVYPDLRQKMHDAVDEYEPQTERRK